MNKKIFGYVASPKQKYCYSKIVSLAVGFLSLLIGFNLSAAPKANLQLGASTQPRIDSYLKRLASETMVKDYLSQQSRQHPTGAGRSEDAQEHCRPGNTSDCIEAACSFVSSNQCNDLGELEQIANSCKGNFNGACLRSACSKLPSYQCDSIAEVTQLARACQGNYGGGCIETTCSYLPIHQCNDHSELLQIANFCQKADANCIKAVCDKLPTYDCNDLEELQKVAEACS